MASVTLAESAKLTVDDLIAGVIENVVTTNAFFEVMPVYEMEGNSLAYNRENALGDVELLGVDGTITAKAAATFTQVTTALTTIIGDAEVNGLIQRTRSNRQDQTALQVGSKAKSLGRTLQNQMINGDGTGDNMDGLLTLVAAGQTIDMGTNGAALTLAFMDQLIDQVTDKDGEVDWIQMNSREHRALLALLRAAGGASISEFLTLPSGKRVLMYRDVPVFRNDWIPINQTKGSATDASTIFAGTLDDGSGEHGISLVTPVGMAGFEVEDVGIAEDKDNRIWRVKQYVNQAMFSALGLASLDGVIP